MSDGKLLQENGSSEVEFENAPIVTGGLLLGAAVGGLLLWLGNPCGNAEYAKALEFATEAVAIGQTAPNLEGDRALDEWQSAEQLWSRALDLLEQVQECSPHYDDALERLDSYAANRDRVRQEIADLQ